jgi:hypothetical protein
VVSGFGILISNGCADRRRYVLRRMGHTRVNAPGRLKIVRQRNCRSGYVMVAQNRVRQYRVAGQTEVLDRVKVGNARRFF